MSTQSPNTNASLSTSSNAAAVSPASAALPPEKIVQFRVMRLYKPSLYMTPNPPALTAASASSFDPLSSGQQSADYIISPFILLPDSFGDIYLGETFSAYVAIVTGIQEIPLYNVNLTVRLQTSSSTFDLYDTRAIEGVQSGAAKILVPYEYLDMIISHKLNELGTHTLRATVQFQAQRNAEVTTIRKFYRFNVLQPFTINSTYIETNDRIMVQCQITNTAKAQLNLLEIKFISLIPDTTAIDIRDLAINESTADQTANESKYSAYEVQILNPGEAYMYGFVILLPVDARQIGKNPRSVGYPELRWSSSLGETGHLRGEEAQPAQSYLNQINTNLSVFDPNTVKILCISYPVRGKVHEIFDIVIRISNQTKQALTLLLSQKAQNDGPGNELAIVGLSSHQLGVLQSGEYMEKTLSVYPSSSGLLGLRNLVTIDVNSGREYLSDTIFQIIIDE